MTPDTGQRRKMLVFAIGTMVILAVVGYVSAGYLTKRIVETAARSLAKGAVENELSGASLLARSFFLAAIRWGRSSPSLPSVASLIPILQP